MPNNTGNHPKTTSESCDAQSPAWELKVASIARPRVQRRRQQQQQRQQQQRQQCCGSGMGKEAMRGIVASTSVFAAGFAIRRVEFVSSAALRVRPRASFVRSAAFRRSIQIRVSLAKPSSSLSPAGPERRASPWGGVCGRGAAECSRGSWAFCPWATLGNDGPGADDFYFVNITYARRFRENNNLLL
ncbi:unnamed protein product [Lampetra fluviatilis]